LGDGAKSQLGTRSGETVYGFYDVSHRVRLATAQLEASVSVGRNAPLDYRDQGADDIVDVDKVASLDASGQSYRLVIGETAACDPSGKFAGVVPAAIEMLAAHLNRRKCVRWLGDPIGKLAFAPRVG
jgi:hypothetical protein